MRNIHIEQGKEVDERYAQEETLGEMIQQQRLMSSFMATDEFTVDKGD